jgi:hypothetical protein
MPSAGPFPSPAMPTQRDADVPNQRVAEHLARCVRTRDVGVRIIRAAHEAGVRRLAMEALPWPASETPGPIVAIPPIPDWGGYLAQPDIRRLITSAKPNRPSRWLREIQRCERCRSANSTDPQPRRPRCAPPADSIARILTVTGCG